MAKTLKVDYSKCTGCRACEMVCSLVHSGECNPRKSNIHNINIRDEIFVSVMCFQCEDPLCARACPADAIHKDVETGLVTIDEERCVGCKLCVTSCPFGNMCFSAETRRPFKCDLCGGNPQCVLFCSTKAIEYVSIKDHIYEKKVKLAHKIVDSYCRATANDGYTHEIMNTYCRATAKGG
jgi:carbon-monoxide dehydrogenase iron sulfur subunit